MAEKCPALLQWFRANGGQLNPELSLQFDADNGHHFIAASQIDGGTNICVCPFSLTLSHLNLLTPPSAGVTSVISPRNHLVGKVDHDVVAQFCLMEQRLKSKESFWFPYIDALPKEDEMTTPLYFKPSDMIWLYGTQLYNKNVPAERTAVGLRLAEWKKDWTRGIDILTKNSIVTEEYTWELYKWAATIFSSRSFTSKIYGQSNDTYPILFPVLDCFNHRFGEQVDWRMDSPTEKSFSLNTVASIEAGNQVFNNYAPKANEELLLGYGFCTPNNPCDEVGMRLAQPPAIMHDALRQSLPDHFVSQGFDPREFIFRLRGKNHFTGGHRSQMRDYGITCMRGIPENMALTLHMLASYTIVPESQKPLEKEAELWYATFDMLLGRLHDMKSQITMWNSELPSKPRNSGQKAASIYRDGQLAILSEIIAEFEEYLDPLENGMHVMERFGQLVLDENYHAY